MSGACRKFCFKSPKGGYHSEDLGIDGRVIFKWILAKWGLGIVDCIHLAQDRDQRWALVYPVMDLRVP
jgi:hypothetical protein